MTGISRYLNGSELKAKNILNDLGWNPIRTRYFDYKSSYGIPDFVCNNKKFVEVKKVTRGSGDIIFHIGQLKKIKRLNKKGNKTYIMIFSDDLNKYDMFEIKHIKI